MNKFVIEAGYKILEIKKEPIYNPDTEYLIPIYEEQGNIIIQNFYQNKDIQNQIF